MSWQLTRREHTVYPRNPLVAVIVDLRFHPILKVADRIADFQEQMRRTHPVFQEGQQQLVNVQPLGGIQIRSDRVFTFAKQAGTSVVTLNTNALTLDSRAHRTRDELFVEFEAAVQALLDVYGFANPMRLGLRYVNMVDSAAISEELGATVAWSDLIHERFLKVPGELVGPEGAFFNAEVTGPVDSGGSMTLRYGRVPDANDKREKFRFDIDRYVEQGFEAKDSKHLVQGFSDEIYWLFAEAMGPALERWMNEGVT